MAPRPAKRQRRSTTVLSDADDADFSLPSTNPTKSGSQREITLHGRTSATVSPVKSTKSRPASKKIAAKASPVASPEKSRKGSKVKDDPVKNKSIQNFFDKATDEQRWRKKSQTPDVEIENNAELSDAIEDDDLSDDTLLELGLKTNNKTNTTLDRRKPSVPNTAGILKSSTNGGALPSSQRFIKPTLPARHGTNGADAGQIEVEGHRPWADRYGPTNLDELMVHKKKVTDVQNWLLGKMEGRNNQKLLVLKGPAGSGKTTTIHLLARAMGLQLVSWHNPVVSDSGPNNSTSAQFAEFLNRGGQFGSLVFDQAVSNGHSSTENATHQLLVVEEFPAAMTRSSNTLQSFRSVILQFLARAKATPVTSLQQRPSHDSPPVIMIISETLLSSSTAVSDSFTAHRLFGPEILNHSFVTAMDFNPVAATFMTKALDLVVKKEARDSGRRRTPGPGVIARLAEIGDIRSAVNSLEFLCLRAGDGSEWSGTVAAKAKRTSKDNPALTESEKNSLALISQRETTLDMFHAAGKIVYNKRENPRVSDTRAEPPPKPPDHLIHLHTPKVSQVDIEALLNETGTDIQTFISTLHENYTLSCYGDHFEGCFDGCSDIFSMSDILNPESRPNRRGNGSNPNAGMTQSNFQTGSPDALRQDEISFNVATRGLLFNLPFPVNRAGATLPGGKRGDVFKMFYPASMRLWKPTEEMQGLLDMFVYGDGGTVSGAAMAVGVDGTVADPGVANWRSRDFALDIAASSIKVEPSDEGGLYPGVPNLDADDASCPRPVTHAKDTLVLDLLPYTTRIIGARKGDTSTLEKITKFKPANHMVTADEGLDEDDDVNLASETAAAGPSTFGRQVVAGKSNVSKIEEPSVEKLYIEEDDIEDD